MLKIDKRSDDQEGNKNPVGDRHLPREHFPNCQEKERGNQFDGEIAERNFGAAICATAAKREPTEQRQVLVPGNRLLAVGTKRPARSVNREVDWPSINTDVQE